MVIQQKLLTTHFRIVSLVHQNNVFENIARTAQIANRALCEFVVEIESEVIRKLKKNTWGCDRIRLIYSLGKLLRLYSKCVYVCEIDSDWEHNFRFVATGRSHMCFATEPMNWICRRPQLPANSTVTLVHEYINLSIADSIEYLSRWINFNYSDCSAFSLAVCVCAGTVS